MIRHNQFFRVRKRYEKESDTLLNISLTLFQHCFQGSPVIVVPPLADLFELVRWNSVWTKKVLFWKIPGKE